MLPRYVLMLSTAFVAITLFIGTVINHLDDKYVRFKSPSCKNGILSLNARGSDICCSRELYWHDWVCSSAYDKFTEILSSRSAFVIPFIPMFLSFFTDFLEGNFLSRNDTMRIYKSKFCVVLSLIAIRMVKLPI